MTKRSKSATLKIDLNARSFFHSRVSNVQEFLAIHLSRIQSIQFYKPALRNVSLQDLFQDLPAHSARCLERLNLGLCLGYSRRSNAMALIERLLDGSPRLRRLRMRCDVDWGSKILTDLTHLTLHHEGGTVTKNPFAHSEFLDALARMPSLRKLHLHKVPLPAPPTEGLSSESSSIVDLPQLQSILLFGSPPVICNVLSHISFPEGTRFRLTLEVSMASDVAVISSLFRGCYTSTNVAIKIIKWPLARSLNLRVGHKRAHLMARSHSSQNTTLDGGLSLPDDEDSFLKLSLLWSLRSPTPNGEEIKAQAILEMCSALPFQSLNMLSLISEVELAGINAESLAGALGRQPEVQSVHVEGPILKAFLGFLAAGAQMRDLSKVRVNLPSLRYLSIRAGRFKRSWLSVQVLQNILRRRKQFGMKLKHVNLKRCSHLFASDVKTMRKNVYEVTWDKHVSDPSSEYSSSSLEDVSESDGDPSSSSNSLWAAPSASFSTSSPSPSTSESD
jgi:hypothetical protein